VDADALPPRTSTHAPADPRRLPEALQAALHEIREDTKVWGSMRLELALAVQELVVEADVVMDLHHG
jgi:hypothetical protein